MSRSSSVSSEGQFGDMFGAEPEAPPVKVTEQVVDLTSLVRQGTPAACFQKARAIFEASWGADNFWYESRLQPTFEEYPHHPLLSDDRDVLRVRKPTAYSHPRFPSQVEGWTPVVHEQLPLLTLHRREAHHSLWGHLVWNSALYTSKRILCNDIDVRNKTVLEVGAGLGVPSLVAALHGARTVVVSDYPDPDLINVLEMNAAKNVWEPFPDKKEVLHVLPLLWGSQEHIKQATSLINNTGFDIMILSDVLFNHRCSEDLVKTVAAALLKDRASAAYVVFNHHRPHRMAEDLQFFDHCAAYGLDFAKIDEESYPLMFPNDPGPGEIRGPVHCYKLTHRFDDAGPPIDPFSQFDVIIQGTGMTESFLSAALARAEKKVLHLDASHTYGSAFLSCDLATFDQHVCGTVCEGSALFGEIPSISHELKAVVHERRGLAEDGLLSQRERRQLILDTVPLVHLGRGDMVNTLIESNATRSLEFMAVDRVTELSRLDDGTWVPKVVPYTRADVFRNSGVLFQSMFEIRRVTKLMKDIERSFEHNDEDSGNEHDIRKRTAETQEYLPWENPSQDQHVSFRDFLRTTYGLSNGSVDLLTLGGAMISTAATVQSNMNAVRMAMGSVGRFGVGESPFLCCMYGSGEIPQNMCRISAVWDSTFILRRCVRSAEYNDHSLFVTLSNGQRVATKALIRQSSASNGLFRAIVVTSAPLISWKHLEEKCNDAIPQDDEAHHQAASKQRELYEFPLAVAFCKINADASAVIHQLGTVTGHAPERCNAKKICVVHITAGINSTTRDEFEKLVASLTAVDDDSTGAVGIPRSDVLYSCTFELSSSAVASVSAGGAEYSHHLRAPMYTGESEASKGAPVFEVKPLLTSEDCVSGDVASLLGDGAYVSAAREHYMNVQSHLRTFGEDNWHNVKHDGFSGKTNAEHHESGEGGIPKFLLRLPDQEDEETTDSYAQNLLSAVVEEAS